MPLADMGLVSQLDPSDAALIGAKPIASQRVVRCAAGFYGEAGNADAVAQALRTQFGVPADRIAVIRPQGLTHEGFARIAQQWQSLRPDFGAAKLVQHAIVGTLTGLVTGGMAALVGWVFFQHPDATPSDAAAWMMPGMWAGAIAGAVTSLVMSRRQSRHRFDDTVARKLRRGYSVVVSYGLDEGHEAPVLAYLQDTSHSWCAEAPRRELRL